MFPHWHIFLPINGCELELIWKIISIGERTFIFFHRSPRFQFIYFIYALFLYNRQISVLEGCVRRIHHDLIASSKLRITFLLNLSLTVISNHFGGAVIVLFSWNWRTFREPFLMERTPLSVGQNTHLVWRLFWREPQNVRLSHILIFGFLIERGFIKLFSRPLFDLAFWFKTSVLNRRFGQHEVFLLHNH